jgi:hypothetical protein
MDSPRTIFCALPSRFGFYTKENIEHLRCSFSE